MLQCVRADRNPEGGGVLHLEVRHGGLRESLRNELGRMGLGVTAICPTSCGQICSRTHRSKKVEEHKAPPRIVTTTPERVANATIKAIFRNRRLVVMEPFARLLTP